MSQEHRHGSSKMDELRGLTAEVIELAGERTRKDAKAVSNLRETVGVLDHMVRPKAVKPFEGYGSPSVASQVEPKFMSDPSLSQKEKADLQQALTDQSNLEAHSRAQADEALGDPDAVNHPWGEVIHKPEEEPAPPEAERPAA